MLKLEVGKTYPARVGPNNSGNIQYSEFTIVFRDGDVFVGRGVLTGHTISSYRAFTEHGQPFGGNSWSLFENPPKPRAFQAFVIETHRGDGFVGYLYDASCKNSSARSALTECGYKEISVIEVLPNA